MHIKEALAISAITLYLILAMQPANALKCWNCTSPPDEWCNDPFQSEGQEDSLIDCTNEEICVKMKTTLNIGDETVTSTVRACGQEGFCDIDEKEATVRIGQCITCDTDGCNICGNECSGATDLGSAILLVAVAAILCNSLSL